MPTLNTLIETVLRKAGEDPASEKYKSLFNASAEEVITQDVITKIDTMFPLDQAKEHPEVKRHFYASNMSLVDEELRKIATSNGLSNEQFTTLESEKNTFKRMATLVGMLNESKESIIKELKAARKGDDPDKVKVLEERLKAANDEIISIKTAKEKSESELKEQFEMQLINTDLSQLMHKYEWSEAYGDDETKSLLFKTTLDKKLSEIKAKLIRKDNKLVLIDAETGLEAYNNNTKQIIELNPLVDSLMSEKKFIKTAEPRTATPGAAQNRTPDPLGNRNNNPKSNPFLSSVQNALDDYAASVGK